MAHHQKAVAAAVIVNSAIFVVEAIAGYQADSLSLIMDSIHNVSDELALIFIYLAFVLSQGISRHWLRGSNVFNSFGLILVSAVLLWQSIERLAHPVPVQGVMAIAVGIAAAAANWSVARLLLNPGRNNAAIRLAYIHNMGDVYVSLAPVAAGLSVTATGYATFDTIIGAAIAVWFIASTGKEILQSHEELIWPEKIVCGHPDHIARS